MKKVKGMLAGIAVLAVIGGAFAFKAKAEFGINVFTTVGTAAPTSGACTIANTSFTVQTTPIQNHASVYYTLVSGQGCFTTLEYTTTKL